MRLTTTTLLTVLLVLGLGTHAMGAPVQQGAIEGTQIAIDESGSLGHWTLDSFEPLRNLSQINPALSSIRVVSVSPGDAVAPGETVRLLYGGLDRTYVSLLRYRPTGAVELAIKNRYFNKLETRSWIIDVAADGSEGAETFVSVTSREALPDEWFDTHALMPHTLVADQIIAGSSSTWYKVLDQTGMQIDRSGGQAYGGTPSGGAIYSDTQQGSGGVTQTTNINVVQNNPYSAYGGMTANQPNPYYRPIPQAGAWRYNPLLYRYGYLPYYSPAPFQVWVGPGGTIGQPYYLYDFGGVGVLPSQYYIAPGQRGVRTNFNDVLFSADISNNGLILRTGNDFIEGELSLGGHTGFSLRLHDVRDRYGRRYSTVPPLVVYIDGIPYTPLIDPNTGDVIVNLPSQRGNQGGLGSRIRVQPANIRTGPIGIGRIDVMPHR